MKTKSLVAIAAVVVALVAGIVMLGQPPPRQDSFIYLLDARSDSSKPLEQTLPVIEYLERKYSKRTYSFKVIVLAAASVNQLRDYPSMFEEFDRKRDLSEPLPMFFMLDKPHSNAKKALRASIDERTSLHGKSRTELLRSLIIVRDTEELNERDECRQLDDDISYATWNFLGIGLLVHDGTLQNLKKCIDSLPLPSDA